MTKIDIREPFQAFRETAPLVQCITNYVAMNISANVLLAAGASPAMVHAEEEVEAFAGITQGLSINIGTLSGPWVNAMLKAAAIANDRSLPWSLDPVAAGATTFRLNTAEKLLQFKPAVVRGNPSEVLALARLGGSGKGVDSLDDVSSAMQGAQQLANTFSCVVGVTGEVDYVTDGTRHAHIYGGHEIMGKVTAMGCSLTSLVAGFTASFDDPFAATVAALGYYGLAGVKAARISTKPGSFAVAFLDQLHETGPDELSEKVRIEFS